MNGAAQPHWTVDSAVLAACGFLAAPLAIYVPLAMAPLAGIAMLIVLLADMARHRGMPRDLVAVLATRPLLRGLAILLGVLIAWSAASIAWAVQPAKAAEGVAQLTGVCVSAIVLLAAAAKLDLASRRRVGAAVVAGIMTALAVLVAAYTGEIWLNVMRRELPIDVEGVFSPYNRGLSVLVLLTAPALLVLRKRVIFAGVLFAAVITAAFSYYGASLQVSLFAAIVVGLFATVLPRSLPTVLAAVIVLAIGSAPLLPRLIVPQIDVFAVTERTGSVSIAHRLIIWQFVAERIAEKPLSGWGFNAARAIPGGNERVPLADQVPPPTGERLPLHPHNAPLQWWLELGAPGAALALGVLLLTLTAIRRHITGRAAQAIALGGFVAGCGVAGLSYGVWQSWWLSAIALATALTVAVVPLGRPEKTR